MTIPSLTIRLDKWLWHARFFRTRALAAATIAAGHVRVNGVKVSKPGRMVGAGDTLTFPQGGRIRLIRITDTAERRGPATDALALYLDLDAPAAAVPTALESWPDLL